MKHIRTILALAFVGILIFVIRWARGLVTRRPSNSVIRAKLDHSEKVLEGLTTEDFEMISKSAARMELLSEEAAWQVLQTPEYRQQSLEFRRATKALKEAADKENTDAAALADVDVTMKCVKCHQYVRNVRNASVYDGL